MSEHVSPDHEPGQPQSREQSLPATIATIDAVGRGIRAEIQARSRAHSATVPTGEASRVIFYGTNHGFRVLFAEEIPTDSRENRETMSDEYDFRDDDPDNPRLTQVTLELGDDDRMQEAFRDLTEVEAQALLGRMKAITPYNLEQGPH